MALKQMETPEMALQRNWLPDDARIWMHSKMLNPHEKQELAFKAPEKPGSYPYVCTFPGHALTMRGTLKVAPPAGGLKGLNFALYHGSWKNLPDFSKLTPHREGKVDDNLLQVKLDDYKNDFGVVFEGTLTAPKKGNYRFFLASDDGARILIDGKEVVSHDGIHPASDIQEKGVALSPGDHAFRLEYFQGGGQIELYAAWKGADTLITPLSKWIHPGWSGGGAKKKADFAPIPLVVKDEAVIYRNFIAGAGNRAIGVGYPGGFNIAWSAESMNLSLIWRGAFMDASRHWNSRGGGHQAPLGYDVLRPTGEVTPAFHIASDPAADWPKWDASKRDEAFEWKGYTLDAQRRPTFRYNWHEARIEETYATTGIATKTDVDVPARLMRTLKITGEIPLNAWIRLAEAEKIEARGGNTFLCHEKSIRFLVVAENAQIAGKNLVVRANVGTTKVSYQWMP
jgi:hypothetical protein